MWEAFREGGWGMIPTLVFGALLVVAGLRYALRPERRFVPLLVGLGITTLMTGGLGFVTGVIKSFRAASGDEALVRFALAGVAESAQNIVLALGLALLAMLAVCAGALQVARAPTGGT